MSDPSGMRTNVPKKRWQAFNGARSNFFAKNGRPLSWTMKTQSVAEMDRKGVPHPWPLAAAGTVMIIASILLWIGIAVGVIALF
jgi:hypothetical protein